MGTQDLLENYFLLSLISLHTISSDSVGMHCPKLCDLEQKCEKMHLEITRERRESSRIYNCPRLVNWLSNLHQL